MNTGFLGPAVATVLTVYGIETVIKSCDRDNPMIKLQQCLPFTVLKLSDGNTYSNSQFLALQQCLPFTVLKLTNKGVTIMDYNNGCNSAYRLRY